MRGLRERVRAGGGELVAGLTTQRVIPPDKTLSVLLTYRLLPRGRGGGREPRLEVVMVLVLHDIYVITRTSPTKSDRPAGLYRPSYGMGRWRGV